MTNIIQILSQARDECTEGLEEEGGVILENITTSELQYIKVRNANTGTEIAPVLWTADRFDYAKKVLPLYAQGWKRYASFHTHPQFVPYPSSIDFNVLFPGFPINYIYSPVTQEITQWNVLSTDKNKFELAGMYRVADDSVSYNSEFMNEYNEERLRIDTIE